MLHCIWISSCLSVPCHNPYLLSQSWCGFVCSLFCWNPVAVKPLLSRFCRHDRHGWTFQRFYLFFHFSTVTDASHIYRAEVFSVICASVECYSSWEVNCKCDALKIFSYFVSPLLFHLCIISCRRLPEDACTHLAPYSLSLSFFALMHCFKERINSLHRQFPFFRISSCNFLPPHIHSYPSDAPLQHTRTLAAN